METTSSTLRFAGDVTFDKVELRSLNGQFANIVNQVISIEVYEDLFSPFITLSLVLKESVDYLNLFPFVGEEYLDLRIVTPGTEKAIEGKFYIYKITDRLMVKDREAAYTIKAISEEYLVDVNRKVSKSFSGNISESAYKLTQTDGLNTKKKVIVEKTTNNTMFTAPYWTPTKCINNLATTAINQNKSPSYLFFAFYNNL